MKINPRFIAFVAGISLVAGAIGGAQTAMIAGGIACLIGAIA